MLVAAVVAVALLPAPVTAQDARALLREVNLKFSKVRDYTADVRIRTDIPFVRMMPVNAKAETV